LRSPTFNTVGREDSPVRLATAVYRSGDKQYIIQLGQSLEESSELIENFGWILVAAIPIVLLFACALGYWMAGRALRPVTAITEDARAISALDISKRIAVPLADDELRKLSVTLNEMMDRLETAFSKVTQFTADASHELRTPIAIIRTTAELAVADGSPEASAQALESILEESERTTRLLEDLLVLARSDSNFRSRLENVDLTQPFVKAALQTELLAGEKGISIELVKPATPCFVDGNAELLRRLFLALTDNAVKYTPRGGKITLKLAAHESGFRAEVADTGVGISSKDLPHIFERFYRADKARNRSGGVGLGLSIAEWIARVHHARIEVMSQLDIGTTFALYFHSPKGRMETLPERESDAITANRFS
jgi:signal transduction histidine kinase